ncbi:RNA polymerase sigma factor [Prevotella sp.]|uniref:RNA polymerase sigma factor n=1 Tax=Prevotella sp. TaxID=59823 RepID=UPI0027E32062|nr:sigma-70 family RNA polymerase sigma factor [Prevotella sp.]
MEKKQESFERLVRSNKDTIYTVCYMFSKDEDEVADLFQETLINIWKGLSSFSGNDGALRGWIYRVALNTCISLDRKKRLRNTIPLTMDVNLFDPAEERALRADQLHRRICKLQPFDRAIVLLWLEDLPYEEIGQILGISTKNVSVRLVRIREQMKKMNE